MLFVILYCLEHEKIGNMVIRAAIVYVSALLMLRAGEKRFLGKNTAFDVILGIIFGSVVSRAITGSTAFLPTLAAGLVLVLLHWLFSVISFHSDWFGTPVKGNPRVLVEKGDIRWDAMRKSHISEKDLMSVLRSHANVENLHEVKQGRLERSGDNIRTVVARTNPPRCTGAATLKPQPPIVDGR